MQSLRQFFNYLNDINFSYVVLRNWERLPESVELGIHSDLDLLVYDFDHWREIFPQALAEFPYPRVRFKLPVDGNFVFIDVRYVSDGYYPADFEMAILETREWNPNGFYTPNPIHHRIALAYHVVHHKNQNNYPTWLGDVKPAELLEALKESDIGWTEPLDKSVGRYHPYWKGATSVVSREDGKVLKTQTNFKGYNLIDNEKRILSLLDSIHFPKLLGSQEDSIEVEDCGDPLTIDNLPKDWELQLVQVLMELKASEVIHRDIKPDNLMIKNGVIKLIDFGWAILESDPQDNPPSCLGFPYKPSFGYSDSFSMQRIIKEFQFAIEEKIERVFA